MNIILPSSKKGDLGITKKYKGIISTAIVNNALLLCCIRPTVEKVISKIQNDFKRNSSATSQILTIRHIIEGAQAKNLEATLLFVDFSKAFHSMHRGKIILYKGKRNFDSHCSENQEENRHSPQRKRQRICSACKIRFLTRKKNMAALSELLLQMVTHLHTGSHVKPRRLKRRMEMRAGRKEHKNNGRRHSVFFAPALDTNWLEEKRRLV